MDSIKHSLNTLASGATLLFIGVLVAKILNYAYRVVVARSGVDNYGIVSLAIVVAEVSIMFALLGVDQGMLRYVSYYIGIKDNDKAKSTFKFIYLLGLSSSIVMSVILFYSSNFIAVTIFNINALTVPLKLVALAIPFLAIRNIGVSVVRAFKLVKYDVIARQIFENVVKVVILIAYLAVGLTVIGAIYAYLAAIIASALLLFFFSTKLVWALNSKTVKINKSEILKYSMPLALNSAILLLFNWIDTMFLGYFQGVTAVGLYNAAVPLAQLTYFVPSLVAAMFLPIQMKFYKRKKEFQEIYSRVLKWILIPGVFVATLLILFSKQIIHLLFGEQYWIAAPVLSVLVIGTFTYHFFVPAILVLQIYKKSRQILAISAMGAVYNTIGNYLLIPKFGILGAAVSTSTAFFITGLSFYFTSRKYSSPQLNRREVLFISLAAMATMVITFALSKVLPFASKYIVLLGIVALGLYAAQIHIFKILDETDKDIIQTILAKVSNKLFKTNEL